MVRILEPPARGACASQVEAGRPSLQTQRVIPRANLGVRIRAQLIRGHVAEVHLAANGLLMLPFSNFYYCYLEHI